MEINCCVLTEWTWLPTTALMPSLRHSCLTSSAIDVNGTTNTVVEPVVRLGSCGWFVQLLLMGEPLSLLTILEWSFISVYCWWLYLAAREGWLSGDPLSCHSQWEHSREYGWHQCQIRQRLLRQPKKWYNVFLLRTHANQDARYLKVTQLHRQWWVSLPQPDVSFIKNCTTPSNCSCHFNFYFTLHPLKSISVECITDQKQLRSHLTM